MDPHTCPGSLVTQIIDQVSNPHAGLRLVILNLNVLTFASSLRIVTVAVLLPMAVGVKRTRKDVLVPPPKFCSGSE
jgi:hypothetical protein